jgi:hypothetical protein
VRNNTVFGFEPTKALRLPALDLGPIVVRWNDELLPGLVTAKGRQEAAILERLGQLLLRLPDHGVRCFRFKDLVDPLKSDARLRWAAFLAREDAGSQVECSPDQIQVLRQVLPECAVETRQSFEHLIRSVSAAIDDAEVDSRTRHYLAALWDYLQLRHGDRELLGDDTDGDLLSHRQLSQRLGIPRERIPLLFTTLRQLVIRYRLVGPARSERNAVV